LDVAGEAEQAQGIGYGRAVLAGPFGDLLVGEAQFTHQSVEGLCELDRVEVLSLDILDEGDFEEALVRDVMDDDRNFFESRELGGAPAPLAGDKLVPIAGWPDDQRLQNSVDANGGRELIQALWGECGARLDGVGIYESDG
jgi:hypothetical protein